MKNIRLNSARLRINSTALFYAVGRKTLTSIKALSALGLLAAAFGSAFAVTAPPGSLDTSFGVGGTVVLPLVNTTLPAGDQLTAMAIQADGKILVAGQCLKPYGFAACVTRLNADGSVDRTGWEFDNTYADKPALLAVASNGDILVASSCRTSTNSGLGPGFCAERFASSGLRVPGFADPPAVIGGIRRVIAAYSDELEAMAIQPDGKIVLVGKCATTRLLDTYNFCVMRINADGSPDSSFTGPNGSARGSFLIAFGGASSGASSVFIQADGRIVVAGRCLEVVRTFSCVTRLTPTGAIDTSFFGQFQATAGKLTFQPGTNQPFSLKTAAIVQPNGKVLMTGECLDTYCIRRLQTNGVLDLSTADGEPLRLPGDGTERARVVALQDDDKIIIAGRCLLGDDYTFCLARLLPNGTLDTTFSGTNAAGTGNIKIPIGSADADVFAIALQPDGKIIVAGQCFNVKNVFCLARINSDTAGESNCALDVDGDGKALTENDVVLLLRISLGFRDTALTTGITLSPYATRTDWASIRSYLVGTCGMTLSR
jgi:uncharacterized delta-60 repeat protein